MGFTTLVQDIVYKISGRSAASSGLYTPSDNTYDYALGGIPLLSATNDTRPDTEKPVQQRKQQFDNYKDPGEYSLNQWWLRSQTQFNGGAGIIYQDPDTQGTSKNIRFAHSIGIDPFSDPDNIGLLKESNAGTLTPANTQTSGDMQCAAFVQTAGVESCWFAAGNRMWVTNLNASTFTVVGSMTIPTSTTTDHVTGGIATFSQNPPNQIGTSTEYALVYLADESVAGTNSGIYRASNALTVTKAYTVVASKPGQRATVANARGQLAFSLANNFYMLDYTATGSSLPASPNAKAPLDQAIVAITDGADAIYVAANNRTNGYIYKTTFDSAGVVNGLELVAVLPSGEMVCDMKSYLNTFLVVTTTSGVRVGSYTTIGTSSSVSYGSNIIPVKRTGTDEGPTSRSGFGRIAFYGTLAFITTQGLPQHDGLTGLMAIDLSVENQDQNTGAVQNAWSTWDYLPGTTTPIDSVTATTSGRLIYTTGAGASGFPIVEHSVNLISQGYLDTGRCRFNTVEPKLFKYFSIRTPTPLGGNLTVSLLDDSGGITTYITYGPTLDPSTNDIATPTPGGPRNWEVLRFTLNRGQTDSTIGAVLDSWQIKALPGVLKQRVLTRNFLCFNSERDKTGNLIAGDTMSLDVLTAIRQMCQRGDTVTFQDLVNNISDQVIIDDYQFTMLAPPGPNGENYGGYLTVEMRTVADSVPPISLAGGNESN